MEFKDEYFKITHGFDLFACFSHNDLFYFESPNQLKEGQKILVLRVQKEKRVRNMDELGGSYAR